MVGRSVTRHDGRSIEIGGFGSINMDAGMLILLHEEQDCVSRNAGS